MNNLFGSRLRIARVRLGHTQKDLARMLDVREDDIRRWERGTNYPTPAKLGTLADAVDVSLDWLYGREGAREPRITAAQRERIEADEARRKARGQA